MKMYNNQTFENQAFVIEESYFVNCVLRNCDLFYSGGDTEWENTRFDNCRFHWQGAAAHTVKLLKIFGWMKDTPSPQGGKSSSLLN